MPLANYLIKFSFSYHKQLAKPYLRRVFEQIRGHSYEKMLMILEPMPFQACYPILILVYSTTANARYNMGSCKTNLVIRKAKVNEGSTVKDLKL